MRPYGQNSELPLNDFIIWVRILKFLNKSTPEMFNMTIAWENHKFDIFLPEKKDRDFLSGSSQRRYWTLCLFLFRVDSSSNYRDISHNPRQKNLHFDSYSYDYNSFLPSTSALNCGLFPVLWSNIKVVDLNTRPLHKQKDIQSNQLHLEHVLFYS